MQFLMGGVEKIRHQISVQNRVRNSADDVSVVSNQPIVVYINNMAATVLHRKVDSACHGCTNVAFLASQDVICGHIQTKINIGKQ